MDQYESGLELMIDSEEYELEPEPLSTIESAWDDLSDGLADNPDPYRVSDKDLEMAEVEKAIERAQVPEESVDRYFPSEKELNRLEEEMEIREAIRGQVEKDIPDTPDLRQGTWLLEEEWEEQKVETTKFSKWRPL